MKGEENKTVNLDEQLKAERALFLGKLSDTDKIPGSNLTLAEARENQKKVNAEFEETKRLRAQTVNAKIVSNREETFVTKMVVPGVNVEIKAEQVQPAEIIPPQMPELPSDAELKKMSTADLIILAGKRGVEVKANVDTEAGIIARLKGEYTDAKFAPLGGKGREVLDGYAIELGLGTTAEDLKEKFANIELLSDAIETARKK